MYAQDVIVCILVYVAMQQYPLVFLSHMGHHVKAYAQSQLEWSSDSACRGFYNGQENPFKLNEVQFYSSVRDMEARCNTQQGGAVPGPKVVIVTDSCLSHGLSKELLIKWGGDPRNSVLFTDYPLAGSLAEEIIQVASTGAPCIVNVSRLQV